jgi:excisionase family DNA binding protein
MSTLATRPSPWMTADEAAPFLATTAHSLRRLARAGRSPIVTRRVGSRWLFSRADLVRFCDPISTEDGTAIAPGHDDNRASRIQVRPPVIGPPCEGSGSFGPSGDDRAESWSSAS